MPRVKRELNIQPQLSASVASSNTDLHILKQLENQRQDLQDTAYQGPPPILQPQTFSQRKPSPDPSAYY